MKKKYYLAYGSNLNVHQMAWRCPHADVVGIATLENWKLSFRGSGTGYYLTIDPCPGSEVPVGVWSITPDDEISLDHYEGCPTFYRKETFTVSMDSILTGKKNTIKAIIYIMGEHRPIGFPSPQYLRTVRDGYLDFGFDIKPLNDALASSLNRFPLP